MKSLKLMYFISISATMLISGATIANDHLKNISWSGDLRYRHELIDTEGSDKRHRHRIRGRIAAKKTINDSWKVGARLSTGSTGGITSRNQTLDGSAGSKSFNLDQFWAKWSNANSAVTLGKMKNPLYRAQDSTLIWDSDVTPEGIAYAYKRNMDSINFFLNTAGFWLNEQSSGADSGLVVGQLGTNVAGFNFGASYYGFTNFKGNAFVDAGAQGGNTADGNGNYATDYNVLEIFADWQHNFGDIKFSIGGSFISNSEASANETGHQFGFKVSHGQWSFKYYNMKLEADATVSALTDSNGFGGGTDGEANAVKVGYKAAKNFSLGAAYYAGKTTIATGNKADRAHFDLKYKF